MRIPTQVGVWWVCPCVGIPVVSPLCDIGYFYTYPPLASGVGPQYPQDFPSCSF